MTTSYLIQADGQIIRYEMRTPEEAKAAGVETARQLNLSRDKRITDTQKKVFRTEAVRMLTTCEKQHMSRANWGVERVTNPELKIPQIWQVHCRMCELQFQLTKDPSPSLK